MEKNEIKKIESNGLTTDYYKLPKTRKMHEIIEYKNMSFGIAYIFESCYEMTSTNYEDAICKIKNIKEISLHVLKNYKNTNTIEYNMIDWKPNNHIIIPNHAQELRHLISFKSMSKSRGDIFKACYRLGEKLGTDITYDLNKISFFADDLLEMCNRKEHI
jgi:hypothetical protein